MNTFIRRQGYFVYEDTYPTKDHRIFHRCVSLRLFDSMRRIFYNIRQSDNSSIRINPSRYSHFSAVLACENEVRGDGEDISRSSEVEAP